MESEPSGPAERPDFWVELRRSRLTLYAIRVAAFLPIVIVTVVVLVYRDRIEDLQTVGYFGIFVANVIGSGTLILPVPGIATVIFGATVWNPLLVGLAGGTGATVGEIAGYLAGVGSYGAIQRIVGKNEWYERLKGWIERRGMITIFVFAATPNPFFDAAGFAAGSMRYPLTRFVMACWLGKMVKYMAVSYAAYWGADLLYGWFG